MTEIVDSEQWELKPFGDLAPGDLFVPRTELIELIDQELVREPEQRRPPEAMIEAAVCRRIPPIDLGDGQVRNAVLERLQAWRWYCEQDLVVWCGRSQYEVDQVRAQQQPAEVHWLEQIQRLALAAGP